MFLAVQRENCIAVNANASRGVTRVCRRSRREPSRKKSFRLLRGSSGIGVSRQEVEQILRRSSVRALPKERGPTETKRSPRGA